MTLTSDPDSFWDFSVELYDKPGVANACLTLQERFGLDVNLLLFCIWWAATSKAALDPAHLESVLREAQDWHRSVVLPLRTARRMLGKGSPMRARYDAAGLFKQILSVELEAERQEQRLIARAVAPAKRQEYSAPLPPAAHALRNVKLYFAWARFHPTLSDMVPLQCVIGAGCGQDDDVAAFLQDWLHSQ